MSDPSPSIPATKPLLDAEQMRKRIRAARIALAIVGVVSLGVAIFETVQLHRELARVGLGLGDIETVYLVLMGVAYLWSFGFLALSFAAKKRPFGAALTGLILYGIDIVLGVVVDPSNLYKGLVMKAIIVAVLVKAVSAGREYRQVVLAEAAKDAFS